MRTLFKIAGYTGLALVVLGIVAYLARDPLRDALAQAASAWLSKSLHGSLHIGKLRGSLVGSLVLQDVELRDVQDVVLRLDQVRLVYHPLTVLTGQLIVSRVEIVRPQVSLVQASDGTWNLSDIFPSAAKADVPPPESSGSAGGLPFAVVLTRLQVRDGQVALQAAALPGIQRVQAIQVRLHGRMDQRGLHVELQQFTAHATPANVDIQTFKGTVQGPLNNLRLDDMQLRTANSLVTAHGALPGGTQAASLAVRMQPLDMAEIGRLIDNHVLQERLELALDVQGPPESLRLEAQLASGGGQVKLQSQLNMSATPLQYKGMLQVAGLDLAALLGRQALHSDLNLQLRVDGQGLALRDLRGQLALDVQPSHIGSIELRPSQLRVEAQSQRFLVKQCHLDTSVARLTASGAIDLQGSSDLAYQLVADLAQLREMLGTDRLAGKVEAQGRFSGELAAIQGHGTIQARNVRYQNNHLVDLRLTYEGRDLGGQAQASAHLDLKQAQVGTLPVQKVQLRTSYQGAEHRMQFAVEVQQSPQYDGLVRGQVTFAEAGQHVRLEALQVRLANRLWTAQVPLEVTVGAGRIRLQPFVLVQGKQTLELSGALNGQAFEEVRLQATDIDLEALRDLVPFGHQAHARASLQVHLTGTFAQPVLQSEVSVRLEPSGQVASDRVGLTLTYRDKRFQTNVRVRQGNRDVLALDLTLPVDLALTALPLEQRLQEAPVTLRAQLQQLDLKTLSYWAPGLPDLSGTMQGTVALQGTYAALDLDTRLRLQQLSLLGVIERVSGPVQLTAGLVTATSFRELQQAVQQGRLAVRMQNLVLRIPSLHGDLPGVAGTPRPVRLDNVLLQAEGRLDQDGLQATVQALRLQAEAFGVPPTDLSLTGRMTPREFELTRLQVRRPQSEIRLHGTLSRNSQQLRFGLDIPRLRLDEFVSALPAALPVALQGTVELRGTLQAPEVDARLRYAGADLITQAKAWLHEPTPRYNATLKISGLQAAQFVPAAQGTLGLQLRLEGAGFTPEQRQARLDVKIESKAFSLAPGLTTDLRARLAGDTMHLERLQLQSDAATFEAKGSLSAAHEIALNYALTLGDLRSLRDTLGLEIQAAGRVTGNASGTVETLQIHGDVQLENLGVAGFRGKGVQAVFTVADLLRAPQATLRVDLTGLEGPAVSTSAIHIDGDYRASQARFSVDVTSGPYEKTAIGGEVVLQEDQRLTLSKLRLHGRGQVWENAEPVEIVRDTQGGLQVARLQLRQGDQEIRAWGTLTAAQAVEANVQIQRLDMPSVVRALAPDVVMPEGKLQAEMRLRGSMQHPRFTGTLKLSALRWQQRDMGEVQATWDMVEARLHTEIRWQDQAQELLRIQGTLGMDPKAALALQILSPSLDMARLQQLHAGVRHSAGRLHIDLRLEGTPQQPQVHGVLAWRDGELQLAATGERYRDMQVELIFAGERVDIKRFDIGSRSGPLNLTGWLEWAGFSVRQLDLAVQADNFTAMHTPEAEGVMSAAIQARGSLEDLSVTGNVVVSRARVRLNGKFAGGQADVEPWQLTVTGVYGPGRDAVEALDGNGRKPYRQAPLPFLRADVTLDIPKNAWLQGPGMAVELRGKMRVTKALQEPFVLTGTVETVRGFASFYGKKFTVQQGKVTFPGTPEINPFLDVKVTHKVSDYIVSITVGGKAREPKLTLSSEPQLEQADIVSLLVMGKTTDRLTVSEQRSFSSQGQQVLGRVAAGQLQNIVGEPLGLDTVEIEAGDQPGTGRIGVGRYVTQDIFLSYEREVGGENENTVGVEYSINRHLKLKGSTSDVGETTIDMFWQLDY